MMFLLEGVDPDDRNPEEQSVDPPVNLGPRRSRHSDLPERSGVAPVD
jgi:hypothetical protein